MSAGSELCGFAGKTKRTEQEKEASRYRFIDGGREEVPEVRLSELVY